MRTIEGYIGGSDFIIKIACKAQPYAVIRVI
jgi:hypothetical protein